MRPGDGSDALSALVRGEDPISEATWRSFWARLRDRRLYPGEALALVCSLSRRPPDAASVQSLLASLREPADEVGPPPPGTVNIVGTGGGPPTFNLSTAAAIVAATLGARVIKTGSRACTSRCGSIDLLERLGFPLTTSHAQTERMVEAFGIACAGSYVYPKELRLLAKSILPFDLRTIGRFFNAFGPFLARVPVSAQVTGVSDPALLPTFRHLSAEATGRRFLLVSNATGVDELVSFEDNLVYDSAHDHEIRLEPGALGLGGGSMAALRPAGADGEIVSHFTALLAGEGPPAAIDSIRLNAAALAIAAGVFDDWSRALESATDSMDRGKPLHLLERMTGVAGRRVRLLR